jgi:N-acetylmuramic acid 6-phosphate (MurNAc-6-P) etherase
VEAVEKLFDKAMTQAKEANQKLSETKSKILFPVSNLSFSKAMAQKKAAKRNYLTP